MPAGRLCRLTTDAAAGTATLEVLQDLLGMADRDEFVAGCRELLESNQKRLVMDLRKVRRIFSMYLGTIVDLSDRASRKGQQLSVKATPPVANLIRSVLGKRFLEIDDGTAPAERGKTS
jgi:anti-anti-sigma regulatory factor